MMYFIFVVFSVFIASCAQMLLKVAANQVYPSFLHQYVNRWVIGGYGIMGISLLINVYCMSNGVKVKEVSIIESLSYLFVPALSFLCFRERLTRRKIVAIVLVLIGVVAFFL